MLILLAVIFAIIAIVGGIFYSLGQHTYRPNNEQHPIKSWCYCNNTITQTIAIVGVVLLILDIICIIPTGICYSNHIIIDEKITMYEEENADIEQKITTAILAYQGYEKDTFANIDTKNLLVAVNLYPELKADTLVSQLIDTYIKNKDEIKQLKVSRLDYKVYKWWLFF